MIQLSMRGEEKIVAKAAVTYGEVLEAVGSIQEVAEGLDWHDDVALKEKARILRQAAQRILYWLK